MAKIDGDSRRLAGLLIGYVEAIRLIFELAYPIIPNAANQVLRNIGAPEIPNLARKHEFIARKLGSHVILAEPSPLFPKLELDRLPVS